MTKISYLFLMTMIGVLFALGGCEGGDDDDTTEEEIEGDEAGECSDGADNDQDGLFDCDDAGCEGSPDCDGDDDDISDDDDDASDDDDDFSDDDDDDTGDDDDTVSGWTFLMGSPVGEVGRGDDESQHHVTLTMDPEIGEKEVTQEEYEGLMGWNPSNCYYGCGDDIPVQYLSWFDAVAYTTELSLLEGLTPCYVLSDIVCVDYTDAGTDYLACMNDSQGGIEDAEVSFGGGATTPYECEGYRLPTEAEWEFAARSFGAVSGTFTNGANLLPGDEWECDGNLLLDDGSYLDDVLWYCGNTPDEQFHPVGEKEPNGWGLYDMPGNVDEWCHDYWNGADYDGDAIDPWGDPTGNYRVTRGGGWEPWTVRIAHRGSSGPGFPWPGLGFRLARTLGPH